MMDELEVRIEKIVAGGDGLARHEGRVVFVPGAAPGELHRVRAISEKKDYIRARSLERLTESEDRRSPPCPYYETCGGCALMHLEPEAQLEAKRLVLLESLERANKKPYDGSLDVVSADELGYRNRLRFGVTLVDDKPVAGFRKRGSQEIVDIDRCLLSSPGLEACWSRVRRALRDRRPLSRSLVAVELEESTSEPGRIAARFVVSSTHELRWLDEGLRESLVRDLGLEGLELCVSGLASPKPLAKAGLAAPKPSAKAGPVLRTGHPWVEHLVSGFTLRQSVGSFFQSNRFLLQPLVDAALPAEGEASPERALDLYSGVGLFSLPLRKRAGSVLGVESDTMAIRDARENAARAGLEGIRFVRSDATNYVTRAKLRPEDYVLVDPPRGGLPPALVEALAESPLRALRYVSCDPPALVRDAARLAARGFSLERLVLLDLFPNTHHFETVASFARGRSVGPPPRLGR